MNQALDHWSQPIQLGQPASKEQLPGSLTLSGLNIAINNTVMIY